MKMYTLLDHTPIPAPNLLEWARWFEIANRQVEKDHIGDIVISTVFLGIDHSFDVNGPPLLFETMIFGGEFDQEQRRYSTWEEAEAGHQEFVKMVKIGPRGPKGIAGYARN